jgi:hypothetical protein
MSSPSSAIDNDEFDVVILGGGAGAKMIWGSVGECSVAVVEQSRDTIVNHRDDTWAASTCDS